MRVPFGGVGVRAESRGSTRGNSRLATTTTQPPPKRIGERLIEADLISQDQLDDALDKQKGTGLRVVEMLIELGHVGVDEIAQFLAGQPGTPSIELANYQISEEICALNSTGICLRTRSVSDRPLGKTAYGGYGLPLGSIHD